MLAAALSTISSAINAGMEADGVYKLILSQATSLLPYDEAAITLLIDGRLQNGPSAGCALGPSRLGALLLPHWRDQSPRDLPTYQDEPRASQLLAAAGIRDILSLPLLTEGEVTGWITFASRLPARYGEVQRQIAALLAERAAHVAYLATLRAAHLAARAKLAELEALRQDFIATVSHELRTPLTGILGYLELLLSRWEALDEPRKQNMLARAQSSAIRLEHLISDLLVFSSMEHRNLKVSIDVCLMTTLVARAVDTMHARYRGQQIQVYPSRLHVLVQADAERAIQVITGLLDNAIKYSAEGRPVRVRWWCRADTVEIAVRDYGPGIWEEDLPRLCTRFGTLGHRPRPGQGGNGIGLYICKKILEAMHGQLRVISRPGLGSIFLISLPRVSAAWLPMRQADERAGHRPPAP